MPTLINVGQQADTPTTHHAPNLQMGSESMRSWQTGMRVSYCPPAGAPSSWSWCASTALAPAPLPACPGRHQLISSALRWIGFVDGTWFAPEKSGLALLVSDVKHTVAHDYTHHPNILPCLLRGPTPSPTLPLSDITLLLLLFPARLPAPAASPPVLPPCFPGILPPWCPLVPPGAIITWNRRPWRQWPWSHDLISILI